MRNRLLLSTLLVGIGVLGLLSVTARSERKLNKDENTDKKIAKLIEDLGSDTFSARQKANDGLDAIGAPALEALRKAATSKDAEVRKRAGELVGKIEKRVDSAKVLTPKMIHLVFKDKPLTEAVEDIKKKSGYLIVLHDPSGKLKDKKITLDTGKVPFWNALEQFCSKAGLMAGDPNADQFARPIRVPINPPLRQPGGGRPLQPAQPPMVARAWVPVQVGQITLIPGTAANAVDTTSSVRVRAGDKKNFRITAKEIDLLLEVTPEPKVRIQSIMSVVIDKSIDDNDQKLSSIEAPANPGPGGALIGPGGAVIIRGRAGMWMPLDRNGLGQATPVRLKAGDKVSKSLKELTGTISAQVLSEPERMLTVDKIMKSAGKSFKGTQGGEMKILTATKRADGVFEITFEFEMPANVIPETQSNAPETLRMPNPPPLPPIKPRAGGAQAKVQPPQPLQPGVRIAIARPIRRPLGRNLANQGLTLQDDKGNTLPVSVLLNLKKGGIGGPAGGKMEYIMTTVQTGKAVAEPAKLVFTARRPIAVSIPFTLKNVELK